MFFIIGEQEIIKRKREGKYLHNYCSKCETDARMYISSRRSYFTFFLIPLFPVEKGDSVLTCENCNTSYVIQTEDWRKLTRKENIIRMYPD